MLRALVFAIAAAGHIAIAAAGHSEPSSRSQRRLQASSNTTISFFNVGACSVVAAVKFDFDDPLGLCPEEFKTLTGGRCHVPGPYGVEVYVTLAGQVDNLVITVLDPSDDDANLTSPTRVSLAPIQRRNHVGTTVRAGTAATACALGFTLFSEAASSADIEPRYFRSFFRHAALGVASAHLVSNGDSTVATLSPGSAQHLDQLLVTVADMPEAVRISFVGADSGATLAQSALEATRLWGTTCEQSTTGFVLYGRPPELPLGVLRLDGAGVELCTYDEATTNKFAAEVAFYNTVAAAGSFVFAFGLSPFLPYVSLQKSAPLGLTENAVSVTTQPGELFVKVADADSGEVRVLSQRVPISAQRRNHVGLSLAEDGSFRLDLLQAEDAMHTAAPVAAGHFRLLFGHAALTLPDATVTANDDIELTSVTAGGHGHLDHPLLPPHQAGRILKVSFLVPGQPACSALIDLSTLCDGAAYALVLVGTADRLDAYDPLLVQVGGTATVCSLSSAALHSGESSSLALLNMAPHATSVRFEWGETLLSLTRQSVPLPFRASSVTDVPTGDLFVRLLRPEPPYEPLTPITAVTIHAQARNALVARAHGSGASPSWRIVDIGSSQSNVGTSATRLLLLNCLEASAGGTELPASAAVSGSADLQLSLGAGAQRAFEIPADGGASVDFSRGAAALGAPTELPFGEACAQSVQLIALGGVVGTTPPADGSTEPDLTPGPTHVDVADGYCRLVVPVIPEGEALEQATTQPPATTSSLDLFGLGDGGLLGSAAPARRPSGASASLLLLLPALLLLSSLNLVRDPARPLCRDREACPHAPTLYLQP